MAMNNEQLTNRINELVEGLEVLRQEVTRRGLEHRSQHVQFEEMQKQMVAIAEQGT